MTAEVVCMQTGTLRLNCVLVILIGIMSLSTSPTPVQATAGVTAGGACGVCWYGEQCPDEWQREDECQTECGEHAAGHCVDGDEWFKLWTCGGMGVPDYGWECTAN